MTDTDETDRRTLGFAQAARDAFSFVRDFGLREVGADVTLVQYASPRVRMNVYHGRISCELGIEIALADASTSRRGYSMSALIGIADHALWKSYRNTTARTPELVRAGLERLAELVRRYGEGALRGDEDVFERLAAQREEAGAALEADVRYEQTLPKAEAAFRERDYKRAAELYATIEVSLTPAERQKYLFARKRS